MSRYFFYTAIIFFFLWLALPATASAQAPDDPLAFQWAYADMKAFDAWDISTGSRQVVVAVIDNGFDTFHPDLYENAWKNVKEIPGNGIDDDRNGYADDVWGWNFAEGNNDPRPSVLGLADGEQPPPAIHHGTLVAGLIGSVGNNALNGAGINWRVRLMNIKVVDNTGIGDILHFNEAVHYAVDNGADIINVSMVADEKPGLAEAVRYAYDHGVAMIAAVGNEGLYLGGFPRFPVCVDAGAAEQMILGVSAIDETHHLARFSNYGSCVDITAPGVHVSSTLRYAPQYGLTEQYGGGWSGTSFASPLVSGTAALLKSIHPEWGAKDIFKTLLLSVNKTPSEHEDEYRQLFGAGRIQADKAVRIALQTLAGARPFSHVFGIDSETGAVEEHVANAGPSLSAVSPIRKGDAVASAAYQGAVYVAAVRTEPVRGEKVSYSAITVYNERWETQESWQAPSRGPMTVAMGDVIGDAAPEIILAPVFFGTNVYEVFSLDGRSLLRVDTDEAHGGVTLGLAWNRHNSAYEVLAVYGGGTGQNMHRFDAAGQDILRIPLDPSLHRIGDVASGDWNRDGKEDYIVSGGPGQDPSLFFYADDGSFFQQFYAYDPMMRAGIRMVAGDYDRDGADDIAVVPLSGSLPVRVWSSERKKIGEWPATGFGKTHVIATF